MPDRPDADDPPERRRSEDGLRDALIAFRERLSALEKKVDHIEDLAMQVGENTATLRVVLTANREITAELVKLREDFDEKLDEAFKNQRAAPSLRTLITFASTVIVPILLALIGGYFALKGAQVAPK